MDSLTYPVELGYRLSRLAIAMTKRNVKIFMPDKAFLLRVLERYDLDDKQKTIEDMRLI
jgi:hypothetical protein